MANFVHTNIKILNGGSQFKDKYFSNKYGGTDFDFSLVKSEWTDFYRRLKPIHEEIRKRHMGLRPKDYPAIRDSVLNERNISEVSQIRKELENEINNFDAYLSQRAWGSRSAGSEHWWDWGTGETIHDEDHDVLEFGFKTAWTEPKLLMAELQKISKAEGFDYEVVTVGEECFDSHDHYRKYVKGELVETKRARELYSDYDEEDIYNHLQSLFQFPN